MLVSIFRIPLLIPIFHVHCIQHAATNACLFNTDSLVSKLIDLHFSNFKMTVILASVFAIRTEISFFHVHVLQFFC